MRHEIRILIGSAALLLAGCGLIDAPNMVPIWSISLPPPDLQPPDRFYIPQLDQIAAEIGFTDRDDTRVMTDENQELLYRWSWPSYPSVSMALYGNPNGNDRYDVYAVNFEDTSMHGAGLSGTVCEKYLELARLIKTQFGQGVRYRESCETGAR